LEVAAVVLEVPVWVRSWRNIAQSSLVAAVAEANNGKTKRDNNKTLKTLLVRGDFLIKVLRLLLM
jgi:hypothetical protein